MTKEAKQIDNYILGSRIGDGSTAFVFKGLEPKTNATVAIKMVHSTRMEIYDNEAAFFEEIPEHPNLL
jgi:serine/threonine protein kinase